MKFSQYIWGDQIHTEKAKEQTTSDSTVQESINYLDFMKLQWVWTHRSSLSLCYCDTKDVLQILWISKTSKFALS